MKEGFTFNKVSLMFLKKVIFKNFGGGGGGLGDRKEPKKVPLSVFRKCDFSLIFHFVKGLLLIC